MRTEVPTFVLTALALTAAAALAVDPPASEAQASPEWSIRATAIEACSCPMFCQCYFSDKPAAHGASGGAAAKDEHGHDHAGHDHAAHAGHGGEGEHFCRFNMAYKVDEGSHGGVKLDGAKFWIAGDLGDNFGDGQTDWAVVTFDPSVKPAQREALAQILAHVFPVKWESFSVGKDAKIDWQASKDRAEAKLDGGRAGEMVLNRFPGNTDEPIVIQNLRYWGAPRNEGFVLMPNEVQAYRLGDKAFEFKGTNGFMITIDMNSEDLKKAE